MAKVHGQKRQLHVNASVRNIACRGEAWHLSESVLRRMQAEILRAEICNRVNFHDADLHEDNTIDTCAQHILQAVSAIDSDILKLGVCSSPLERHHLVSPQKGGNLFPLWSNMDVLVAAPWPIAIDVAKTAVRLIELREDLVDKFVAPLCLISADATDAAVNYIFVAHHECGWVDARGKQFTTACFCEHCSRNSMALSIMSEGANGCTRTNGHLPIASTHAFAAAGA